MFGKLKERLAGGTNRFNGKTDLLEGVCAAIILVGAADGDLSDDEAAVGLDRVLNHDTLTVAFTSTQIETAFDKQAKRAKQGITGRLALRREIEEVRAKATEEEAEMLLVIAIDVAAADGDIGAKELEALNKIGQALKLDPARYLE